MGYKLRLGTKTGAEFIAAFKTIPLNEEACIAMQRNCIHRFFSPGHKPISALVVDKILESLNIADKAEMVTQSL